MGHPVDETAEAAELDDDPGAHHVADDATDDAPDGAPERSGSEGVDTSLHSDETTTARVAEVGGVDPQQVLAALDERPLAEHAEVYEELHTHLQRTLAEIDGG